MNKIVIDDNVSNIDSYNGQVVMNKKEVTLNINGDNKLFVLDDNKKINIFLNDNASLKLVLNNEKKENGNSIIITQKNKTNIEVIDIFVGVNDLKEEIITNIEGNDNNSKIIIKVVGENGNIEVLEQINAKEETLNNTASEHLKGLCCGGTIKTLPNMEISTNNIVANHFVTISSYNEKELFYLMSKGLSKDNAKMLIKKGFLNNDLEGEI